MRRFELSCIVCGEQFIAGTAVAKTCSDKCRRKHNSNRNKKGNTWKRKKL